MEEKKSRSVIIKKFGGYDALLVENVDLPKLEGNIEIEVDYGGVNFADLYVRQGLVSHMKLPSVLGIECTGTVTAVGVNETELKRLKMSRLDKKVICYNYQGGLYREKVRVNPSHCFPLPEFIDTKEGAAIFVNYLTAYFTLFEQGNLRKNEKVLILSCAGGVGCAATQLAKTVENVQIFGTGSAEKEEEAKKNGVDVFYVRETYQQSIGEQKFDLIITNEAGTSFTFLQKTLNPLGRLIIIGGNNIIQTENKLSGFTLLKAWFTTKSISPESLIFHNRTIAGFHLGTLLEENVEKVENALNYIFDLYKDGKIKPVIHSTWPMSKIVDATKILGSRKNIGKVLIQMKES
ncbi:hypothetical protein NQ318_009165 [Aromia moschata]|uniref:Enoyl reductase (ER) domain-containing protein n=1 Tax=Aromia moschata TaxID=1265417 RepID=A0AAV8XVG3_9CUCU|nr:hypothetical protein NQ318_009165 [Aromia moschata]